MTTIKSRVEITGKGLMKNQECHVEIFPSQSGNIRFFVKKSKDPIIAHIDNLKSTDHCVSLTNNKDKVMLVEHFMAACAFCRIKSIDVNISAAELPILDGSAKSWIELFLETGVEVAPKEPFTVIEPIYYLNGKTHLVILPDEKLSITYAVGYDHPDLNRKWASFDVKKANEIIEARTFGYLKDLKRYQLFGFAKGVTVDNTVGLTDDGYTTKLRSEFEPINHKILDLIGDLYLTGINPLDLKAQIIVKEAGHAVHTKVAKILKDRIVKI